MNKAVFIDKDGTLIHDVPYNVNPDLIVLSEGAGEALRRFKAAGYKLVVISNQAGVAKGLFEETALEGVHKRLGELLYAYDVALDGFYYCPHYTEACEPDIAGDGILPLEKLSLSGCHLEWIAIRSGEVFQS